jgi:hypothetical protein
VLPAAKTLTLGFLRRFFSQFIRLFPMETIVLDQCLLPWTMEEWERDCVKLIRVIDKRFSTAMCHRIDDSRERRRLFARACKAYKEASESGALAITLRSPCCLTYLHLCGALEYQKVVLRVIRSRSMALVRERVETAARAAHELACMIKARELFTSTDFPAEMVALIGSFLTPYEMAQWRLADAWVWRRTPSPRKRQPWADSVAQYSFTPEEVRMMSELLQLAYEDDDANFFPYMTQCETTVGRPTVARIQPLLAWAIGKGAAWRVLSRFPYNRLFLVSADPYMRIWTHAALSSGHLDFVCNARSMTSDQVMKMLVAWDDERLSERVFGPSHKELMKGHPIVRAIKDGHLALFHQLVEWMMGEAHTMPRTWIQTAAAHGDLVTMTRFPILADQQLVNHVLVTGTTDVCLRWLQVNRPELFTRGRLSLYSKGPRMLEGIVKNNCPAIMAWLAEFRYLDMRTWADEIEELAEKHKATKTLTWIREWRGE